MKKLGPGMRNLSKFKKKNLIYVDKTETIHKLINDGKRYFLSRPRRFGKSLLVSVIKELFRGKKSFLKNAGIYDKWDWEEKQPVIKLSFIEMSYKEQG